MVRAGGNYTTQPSEERRAGMPASWNASSSLEYQALLRDCYPALLAGNE